MRALPTSEQYVEWWEEVEECVERERDIREVRFFEVLRPLSGTQFPCIDESRWCSGYYSDSKIYLAAPHSRTERFAKHEMVHAIFLGGPSHESLLFFECT